MIQIGQIRKNSNQIYMESINPLATVIYNKGDTPNTIFYDFGIQPVTADGSVTSFQKNQTYYLAFAVQRYPEVPEEEMPYGDYTVVNFQLVLCDSQGDPISGEHTEKQQTIERSLTLNTYKKGYNQPWQQFAIVFTPTESASYLWFRIKRMGHDYIYPDDYPDGEQHMGRCVFRYTKDDPDNTIEFSEMLKTFEIDKDVPAKDLLMDVFEDELRTQGISDESTINKIETALNNSLDTNFSLIWTGPKEKETITLKVTGAFDTVTNIIDGLKNVTQIGIQSRPGSLFVVNSEPIYLGRSGVYEVNNGTKITSVGVVALGGDKTENIQDFILDYAVTQEEG